MSDTWYWIVIACFYLFALAFLTYKNRQLRNTLAGQVDKIIALESETKKLVKLLENQQRSEAISSERSNEQSIE
jgi:hypothetical protein